MLIFAHTIRGLVLAASLFALSSCGSSGTAGQTTAASTSAADAFPATVAHEFGTTTVPSRPSRIAVVGLTEQDTVLALGEKPVATTEWYGGHPSAVWPWSKAALGAAKPTVLDSSDGFQFEKIAAVRPDLIVGTNAGMKRADYDKLSRIAPTVAAPKGGTQYFSPWDRQTELIARALGRESEGKALVQDVKDRFAKVAAAHPDFAGKTISFSQNAFYDGVIYSYPAGLNTEFLTYLGLKINPKVTALAKKPGEQVAISAERLDVLDTDLALFATEEAKDITALLKVPGFAKLAPVAADRTVYTGATLSGALYFMTAPSLDYVLEHLPAALQSAVDGKSPRTMVE